MKNTILFFCLIISLFILGCDGADFEEANDNFCYFIPETTEVFGAENGAVCDARFLLLDDQGEEYSFDFEVNGPLPLIGLPKDRCYKGWILDEGSGNCGVVTYSFGNDENQCIELVASHDTRGDAYSYSAPEYEFCLGLDCSCPQVQVHTPPYEECSIPYTKEYVYHFCLYRTTLNKQDLIDYYNAGWTIAEGLNRETCGELTHMQLVFESNGEHFCTLGTAVGTIDPIFENPTCSMPCGFSTVHITYVTEKCEPIDACLTELD